MPDAPRLLIVEDNRETLRRWEAMFVAAGFEVLSAETGEEGLRIARSARPAVMVLDIRLPAQSGHEVCEALKADAQTKRIKICMVTVDELESDIDALGSELGPDDFHYKGDGDERLLAGVRALLRGVGQQRHPFGPSQESSIFSIVVKRFHQIEASVRGSGTTVGMLKMDPDIAAIADEPPTDQWRRRHRIIGKMLFERFFAEHEEILRMFVQETAAEPPLRLRFDGPRDFLRLPIEMLYDPQRSQAIALAYPLSRSISGLAAPRVRGLSAALLNEFWEKGTRLNVLLIASNTPPAIPGVDEEVEALANSLNKEQKVHIDVETVPSRAATIDNIRNRLRNNSYDIVHYAGHARSEGAKPDASSLFFWEEPELKGRVLPLTANELNAALAQSRVRLVYLSCCRGMSTSGAEGALDDNFLGLADSIVSAGVPAVFGHRWPVADEFAKAAAIAFYRTQFDIGEVDAAALEARREMARMDHEEPAWLSPILVMRG